VQAGLDRPDRDVERPRDLLEWHPQQVVERDDGTMCGVEVPERPIEQIVLCKVVREVSRRGCIGRDELDLDRSSTTVPGEIEAGVDGESVEPGVEPIRVAQARKIAPGSDERFLDRVSREITIPKHQSGGRVQPRDGQVDKLGEGVMIAPLRSFDETVLVHVAPRLRHDLGGRTRQRMASASAKRFTGGCAP